LLLFRNTSRKLDDCRADRPNCQYLAMTIPHDTAEKIRRMTRTSWGTRPPWVMR